MVFADSCRVSAAMTGICNLLLLAFYNGNYFRKTLLSIRGLTL